MVGMNSRRLKLRMALKSNVLSSLKEFLLYENCKLAIICNCTLKMNELNILVLELAINSLVRAGKLNNLLQR